jgi:hypothetical protein
MKVYYLHDSSKQTGPFNLEELKTKTISNETFVWYEGMDDWKKASEIEELKVLFLRATPPEFNKEPITPPVFIANKKSPPTFIPKKATIPEPLKAEMTKENSSKEKDKLLIDSQSTPVLNKNKKAQLEEKVEVPTSKKPNGIKKNNVNPRKPNKKSTVQEVNTKTFEGKKKKKIIFYVLGAVIGILFYFGHDLSQEVRSIYRRATSNYSSDAIWLEESEVENSKNNISGEFNESDAEKSRYLPKAEQEVISVNYAWGCNQCSKVLYQKNEPNSQNCPVGYTYSGGFGTTHNWRNYGRQGANYYGCKFCGLNIQVDDQPKNSQGSCNSHEYGQALTSSHSWERK